MNSPVQSNPSAGIVFRGRSNRLGGAQSTTVRRTPQETSEGANSSPQQQNQGGGIAFQGRSYRLNG
ncbi:derlin-2 protein [Trifolium pratense]|nr:derlin-2 protein [Trifolium pratense]